MKKINDIRVLISLGKLENAIEVSWESFQDHKFKDDIIAIRSRFNKLRDNRIKGLLNTSDATIEGNLIRNSLMEFLNKIEKQHADQSLDNVNQQLDNKALVTKLLEILDETYKGIVTQAKIRNKLESIIKTRLDVNISMEYEKFFKKYYSVMNAEELRYHQSIRDYTRNILNTYNRKALELILGNEKLMKEIPELEELERHLLVWLGKYENIFKKTPSLSLIYVGVEENVPFPKKIEEKLRKYLKKKEAT